MTKKSAIRKQRTSFISDKDAEKRAWDYLRARHPGRSDEEILKMVASLDDAARQKLADEVMVKGILFGTATKPS